MFFKNAIIYSFTEPFNKSVAEVEDALTKFSFKPCLKTEFSSTGWTPALHPDANVLVHSSYGYLMVCLKTQEKVIPSASIKELLDEKLKEIEQVEGRKVKGKEKQNLKEELIHSLLPTALTKSKHARAIIDTTNGYIMVESSSYGQAENLLAYLRKSLGTLPVVPLETDGAIFLTFDDWMKGNNPNDFTIGTEAILKDFAEDEGTINCKNLALDSEDIQSHLDNGKHVVQLKVEWDEKLSCVLDAGLVVKRIKFSDVIKEQNEDICQDDKLARLDADFTLMACELSNFANRLVELFGKKGVSGES